MAAFWPWGAAAACRSPMVLFPRLPLIRLNAAVQVWTLSSRMIFPTKALCNNSLRKLEEVQGRGKEWMRQDAQMV